MTPSVHCFNATERISFGEPATTAVIKELDRTGSQRAVVPSNCSSPRLALRRTVHKHHGSRAAILRTKGGAGGTRGTR